MILSARARVFSLANCRDLCVLSSLAVSSRLLIERIGIRPEASTGLSKTFAGCSKHVAILSSAKKVLVQSLDFMESTGIHIQVKFIFSLAFERGKIWFRVQKFQVENF